MVDSSRRRGRRRPVMSNHNRCWIWGRNVVLETLRAGRWPILELLVGDRATDPIRDEALLWADRMGVEAFDVPDDELTSTCRSADHQGLAARMSPFPCLSVADVMREIPSDGVIVMLDRLQDPFNVGAIIRSASTLGVDAVIIGEKEQAEISSQVARSSAGAVNHLPIGQTADLVQTLKNWNADGFQIIAATEKGDQPVYSANFLLPTVIVIGNEGRGIHPDLLTLCDHSVSIPMSGHVGSLNAAVAAGILFYEMRRQRCLSNLPGSPKRGRRNGE